MKRIYIATIHWQSDYWIDIQCKYIEKYIPPPYSIFACLNGIDIKPHVNKFDYINTDKIKDHGTKLNLLSTEILKHANDEDLILFLDGDAFPISNLRMLAKKYLDKHPLIAVQRKENLGDIQPHPCFCLTTAKFWKTIKGNWQKGNFTWKNSEGRNINDVGGSLLDILNKNNIDWMPLNRSNEIDFHPVMFGVYHNVVYHHGMGFRKPASRIDRVNSKGFERRRKRFILAKKILPLDLCKSLLSPYNKVFRKNKKLNKKVLSWIETDSEFYRRFYKETP